MSVPITVPFVGGLGNQLFQLGAGLYLESELNRNVIFNDYLLESKLNGYAKNAGRNFEIRELLVDKNLISSKFNPITLRGRSLLQPGKYVWEKSPSDLALNRITAKTKMAFGYFQNSEIVNAAWPSLKVILGKSKTFGDAIVGDKIDQVAIHMRFGDYKNNVKAKSFHGLTTFSYYEDALREIEFSRLDKKLKIFTDDVESARSFILQMNNKYDVEYSRNSSGTEDFVEMARSSELVIGNSTFSWWAAWIANKIHKSKIIYPRPWFATTGDLNLPIYVKEWHPLRRNFDT